ncbi:small ribosomal subunit protein mS29 [Plodia interpunctella]|uniref:small ribosomal subunit protein mS29 n=1 Tax=Plodia interpunctella TaxID=58824 RepID=UPI0023684402|nr:28S ribosomal protein S29, mitochondrial [Plodia interpunctella]
MMSRSWRHLCRRYSQAVTFRTTESSPALHNEKQIGLFYSVDKDLVKQLYGHGGFPRSFMKQTKTFTETTIMVRQPALDMMDCIKATDFDKPINKYVLYGEKGAGKSMTLAHLLHFAHTEGFLIVHVPWVSEWLRRVTRMKEMSNSPTREGLVDLPLDAAAWLLHFKNQNQALLKSGNLTTSEQYVWSKRERTAAGAALLELLELGISRVKFSCDVVHNLLREIKRLSSAKQCKTFVAIDGFNGFFYPLTRLRTPTKRTVKPEEVSLATSFLELTKPDWNNGLVVVTADQLAVPDDHQESFLPKYLLYKQGFEHLDPFIPIEVTRYTEKEFTSCAAYYRDRLWLRGPPETETELKFTSACNPYRFMEQCAPL